MADATPGRSQPEGAILALAHNLETIHAVPLLAPDPEQSVQALANGGNSHVSMTATLVEETTIDASPGLSARFVVQDPAAPAEEALLVLAEETLEIPVKQAVDSLVRPLVESVDTAGTGPVEPPATCVSETEPTPEAEATVLTETQPALDQEEPSAIVPSDFSTAESELSSEPAAVREEPADIVAESETLVPEPEHVTAAPVPSSEPETLLQAGSPWEVTAIPELYVAASSWAHQIRELEQALEPEVLSEVAGADPSASPKVQETASQVQNHPSPEPELPIVELDAAADSCARQSLEVEQASEPNVLSEIAAQDLTAVQEVHEPASQVQNHPSPEPELPIVELDTAADSYARQSPELEQALEPEVPSAIAAQDLTAVQEVHEPASQVQRSPEPESAIVELHAPADSYARQSPELEQALEPEVPSEIAAQDLTAVQEVHEPASQVQRSPEPESAIVELHAPADSYARQSPELEQALEPEVPSAIAAQDLTAVQEVHEPASQVQRSPEPESTIAPPAESPLVVEDLSEAEAPSELAPVPSQAAPALLPDDLSAQSEEPEPAAVTGQQLALDLTPDLEPPSQPEPLAQTTTLAEGEVAPESSTASLNEDSTLVESPMALESPAPVAAQNPPPEAIADAQEARDLEASEALLGAIQLQAEALVDAIDAELEAERAAIRNVVASFGQRCSTSLLAAPAEIVTAPAPPVFEWIRRPRPILQPLPPPAENLIRRSAQPQPLTLAGPCLTPELRNLTDLQGPARSRKPRAFPGWVASLMGAILLVLLAVTSLEYLSRQSDAKAALPTGSQTAAASNIEALDKSVEISGLRLATTWNGKQQVRFLIVNHSAQDLSGVTIQVVVRSSDGAPPILVIHAPLRSLGPYQSKEIKTALDSDIPASALSDWQSLRTDVQVLHGE